MKAVDPSQPRQCPDLRQLLDSGVGDRPGLRLCPQECTLTNERLYVCGNCTGAHQSGIVREAVCRQVTFINPRRVSWRGIAIEWDRPHKAGNAGPSSSLLEHRSSL